MRPSYDRGNRARLRVARETGRPIDHTEQLLTRSMGVREAGKPEIATRACAHLRNFVPVGLTFIQEHIKNIVNH
jgi:hypothetical protein